ncbi:Hint domain-containing protein [Rhodoblastus sp.]|uniref:Hint domain-containing protein n=1 Tax=Rhodoblastus sp. TaxID=1962975 RepID=UPI003F95B7DD
MSYTLSFGSATTLDYLDPQPADPDPTISLFGDHANLSKAGAGNQSITSIQISGLGPDDTLSLTGVANFSISESGGVWTVTTTLTGNADSTTAWNAALNAIKFTSTNDPTGPSNPHVENLSFAAYHQTSLISNFSAHAYSATITCFYPGTMIRTPEGEVAVETLNPGDLVLTADGAAKPVNWLGRQTVSTVFADPTRILPIRVKAGALADNVPARDLLVSPDHALLVDGVLIHAGALVNGASIVRETKVPRVFTYYHIELDDHSLILAENAPAETFVDNVDRLGFDNWAEFEALYPQGKAVEELPYPRAKAHRQVPVYIRVALADRAQAIGAQESAVA